MNPRHADLQSHALKYFLVEGKLFRCRVNSSFFFMRRKTLACNRVYEEIDAAQ